MMMPHRSDPNRLAAHLLARLRHRLECEALDRAVEADILIAGTWDVEGVQVRGFTAHPAMLEKSPRQMGQLVARLGLHGASSVGSGITSMDFDGDTYVIDDQGIRPPVKSGRGQREPRQGSSSRRGGDAGYRSLTATLLSQVRRSASPPQPAEVATLLLVARAAVDSGTPLQEVLRVLRLPNAIVTLTAAVPGFEGTFLDLLARGMMLPGKAALASGYELISGRPARFGARNSERWRIIVFPGVKYDPDEPEIIGKQVGLAALMQHPILGVAERQERLPPRLTCAAQLRLATGPLDMDLVGQVIAAVLGEKPKTCLPDQICATLTLFDLAIAIRPGVEADHAVDVLSQLAADRPPAAAESAERMPGDGRRSTGSSSSSRQTSKSGRGNPGAGSEIIQPVQLTGGDSDRFVARVETLSGYGEAAEWAMSLKADLELWRAGELAWEEMSTKVLLSGPPGTGKTTFARALCNSLQVPLVASSVATWLEPGYLGDVLKRMAATFTEAEGMRPAILFIDELDGIGTRRQRGEWAEYGNSIINRGLELLDGASRSPGVIVVAATNYPQAIDPALLRSGRLEKHVEIPVPDTEALVGILRYHLKGDLDGIVESAPVQVTQTAETGQPDRAMADAVADPVHADVDPVQDDEDVPKPDDLDASAEAVASANTSDVADSIQPPTVTGYSPTEVRDLIRYTSEGADAW